MPNCIAQACSAALPAFSLLVSAHAGHAQGTAVQQAALPTAPAANAAGIIAVLSAYGMVETVDRLKRDIDAKGIMLFGIVDQGGLAAVAGVPNIRPSVLLTFGATRRSARSSWAPASRRASTGPP